MNSGPNRRRRGRSSSSSSRAESRRTRRALAASGGAGGSSKTCRHDRRGSAADRLSRAVFGKIHRRLRRSPTTARGSRTAHTVSHTVTCPGPSTIGNRCAPVSSRHDLNAWYNRAPRKRFDGTEDVRARENQLQQLEAGARRQRPLAPLYDARRPDSRAGARPRRGLLVESAIGDRLAATTAIPWCGSTTAGLATSAYAHRARRGFLQEFIDENPITAASGGQWTRMHPVSDTRAPTKTPR